jgi:hypothetical protein
MCQALTSDNFSKYQQIINYTGIKLFGILPPTMRNLGHNKKIIYASTEKSIYYLPLVICKNLYHMINSKLS